MSSCSPPPPSGNVTQLLNAIESGTARAEQLLPVVYDELRKLASARMANEAANHTLQPTALVHEAYLRLVGDSDAEGWDSRGHFFAAAAEAMRRILIENARRKQRIKHGGEHDRVPLDGTLLEVLPNEQDDLLELDEALQQFEAVSPDKAELVKLRYFAGLSTEEAAQALGISRATAARWWAYAKAWMFDRLNSSLTE